MWILMNDSMPSVVSHNDGPDDLLVRARLGGDSKRVFPQAQVQEQDDGGMSAAYSELPSVMGSKK